MPTPRRVFLLAAWAVPLGLRTARAEDDHDQLGAGPTLAFGALGVDGRPPRNASHEQIELGKAIGRELVCLCGDCPKRLITDCECGWAVQNQNAILAAVANGKPREAIFQAYVAAYGDQVRAQIPPCSENPLGCTAFILPYVAGILGLGAVFVAGMKLRRREASPTAPLASAAKGDGRPFEPRDEAAEKQLRRELEDLD
ncbi:MAG: cytochrome c-type biogenesis protein CcmH [Deltaproteobacteria bacterium]|nr:cytochrome c-type biogenesis protein CcmH [Deltaproteobacteria bacterium]